MMEYVVTQSDGDNFIITVLEQGKYKGVAVKIVDLKFDEKGYIDFEMELPSTRTELFTDEEFKEQIGEMVGDVVKKSVERIWETQNELALIEEKVGKMLDDKNVKRNSDKLLVEQFMEKGFLLKTETADNGEKHFVAIDVKQNKSYNLELDSDFDIVRKSVFSDIIVN